MAGQTVNSNTFIKDGPPRFWTPASDMKQLDPINSWLIPTRHETMHAEHHHPSARRNVNDSGVWLFSRCLIDTMADGRIAQAADEVYPAVGE